VIGSYPSGAVLVSAWSQPGVRVLFIEANFAACFGQELRQPASQFMIDVTTYSQRAGQGSADSTALKTCRVKLPLRALRNEQRPMTTYALQ
jgi:hypothetical protein